MNETEILEATHQDLLRMGLASDRSLMNIRKMSGISEKNKKITSVTRTIRFPEFYRNLLIVFKEITSFASRGRRYPLRILLYTVKGKSNEWISKLFLDFCERIGNWSGGVEEWDGEERFNDYDFLVYLDDMMYSGQQAAEFLNKLRVQGRGIGNLTGIAIATAFATKRALKLLKQTFSYIDLPYGDFIDQMIIWGSEVEPLSSMVHDKKSLPVNPSKFPVYFNHKIADNVSSYHRIYSKYLPDEVTTSFYKRNPVPYASGQVVHPYFKTYVKQLPRAMKFTHSSEL